MADLNLNFGLTFEDLYDDTRLTAVDTAFLDTLDDDLRSRLIAARSEPSSLEEKAESDLILDVSPALDAFIAKLFGIEDAVADLKQAHTEKDPLYACKRLFVQRIALKKIKPDEATAIDGPALEAVLAPKMGGELTQANFAETVMGWLDDEESNKADLEIAQQYAAWATLTEDGRARHAADILFGAPGKIDFLNLVPSDTVTLETLDGDAVTASEYGPACRHHRDGFQLTDLGTDLTGALDQANYCVLCHDRGRDSCSRGIRDKKTGDFQKNPLGITLAGCPLSEKISEMHKAKMEGP